MSPQVSLIVACRPGAQLALGPVETGLAELVRVEGANVSQQRNLGVGQASGELLWFLDDDSQFGPETLRLGLEIMRAHPDCAAAGGPSLTRSRAGFEERVFGAVMGSWFAALSTWARHRAVGPARFAEGTELITSNLLVRREWFEKVGGFDLSLYPGEDIDFVYRLRQAGARLYYHPRLSVERSRRGSTGSFLWQYFRYGLARGSLFFHLRPRSQWIYLLPLLLWAWLPLGHWAVASYLLICLLAGVEVAGSTGSAGAGLAALLVVPLMHLCYGLGLGLGLIYKLLGFSLNQPQSEAKLAVTRHPL
ncbi:hypothetical protein ABS71_13435 [bacterium SCN 62-11]|nr:MAG: hypothetical protein ABS71_13435 [bacterium SCN 62-11]